MYSFLFLDIDFFVIYFMSLGNKIIIEPLNSGQIFQTLSAVLLENWLMAYSRKNSGSAPNTRNDRYGEESQM
jgi:hypothetical protein